VLGETEIPQKMEESPESIRIGNMQAQAGIGTKLMLSSFKPDQDAIKLVGYFEREEIEYRTDESRVAAGQNVEGSSLLHNSCISSLIQHYFICSEILACPRLLSGWFICSTFKVAHYRH